MYLSCCCYVVVVGGGDKREREREREREGGRWAKNKKTKKQKKSGSFPTDGGLEVAEAGGPGAPIRNKTLLAKMRYVKTKKAQQDFFFFCTHKKTFFASTLFRACILILHTQRI